MLYRNARLVLVALLSLSLGACSALSPQKKTTASASRVEAVEPAEAKAKVVIVVDGARSVAVRQEIERMLAEHYEIVPSMQYRKTARRLKAGPMKPRNVVRVASRLGADAVLHGVLGPRRKGRHKLSLVLRDGTTGKAVERMTLPLRARSLRDQDQAQLASRLRPALDGLGPTEAVARNDDQNDGAKNPPRAAETPATSKKPETVAVSNTPKAAPRVAAAPAPGKKPAAQASKTSAEADGELASAPAFVERYDDRGQAIDDEVPSILNRP